jgi:hypothetical protein
LFHLLPDAHSFVPQNLKFPTEKVASIADRVRLPLLFLFCTSLIPPPLVSQVMILIQLVLEGVTAAELKTDNINPMLDVRTIFQAAIRVAKGARLSLISLLDGY